MIMSDFVPNDESVAPTTAPKQRLPSASIWLRELPYAAVLILTLLGVAYTSFTRRPMTGYWEFLVPVMGVVCIWSGWRYAHDKKAQLRLIWTQAAHWLAFFAAMNLLLRAEHAECGCHRPRYSSFIGSRHVCCRCAHSSIGGLHSRFRHGALRAGNCLDRGGRADRAARRARLAWSGNNVLVDREQQAKRDTFKRRET